jgi:hypothetical protein
MYYDNHLRIFRNAGDFMRAKRKHKREKIRQTRKKKSRILKRKPSALKKASLKKMVMALMKQEDKKRKLSQKKRDKRTALLIKQNALLVKQNRELRKRITRRPAVAPARRPAPRKVVSEKRKYYTPHKKISVEEKEKYQKKFLKNKSYASIVIFASNTSPLVLAQANYVFEFKTNKKPLNVSQKFLESKALDQFYEDWRVHIGVDYEPNWSKPRIALFRWGTALETKAFANLDGEEESWRTKILQVRRTNSH